MPKKLIVNGRENPMTAEATMPASDFDEFQNFTLEKSVMVSNSRSASTRNEMVASDGDIVEIEFEDKTTWIGNALEFHEIFQVALNRGLDDDTLEVPSVLQSTTQRGIAQDLAIRVFNLFKPNTKKIVGTAVREIAKRIEEKVLPQPGLFFLDQSFRKRIATNISDISKPYVLFIHGTNSNTDGAFGSLVEKPDFGLWRMMRETYGDNILTFDHKTLTESPLQNVKQLLELLPANVTLHLITHSRGGLVGDLVARANAGNSIVGFSDTELELMSKRESDHDNMHAINKLAREKNIKIEKYVRVASPSMGTSLLADRLDHYLNTILNLVGVSTGMVANPVYAGVKTLVSEVASSKTDISVLPGLEAMSPESPFLKMLNNPANVIEAPLTVISGNCSLHLELKALLVILTKLYFRRKNDMVVDTWSMYFGTPRRKTVQFFLDDNQGTDHIHYFRNKQTQDAIKQALQSKDDSIPGFEPLEAADIAEANRNAALPFIVSEVVMNTEVSGKKPIAIVLPGIMGSNLYKDDDRIWVDFWRFVKGDLVNLEISAPNISAKSLMGSGYRKLARYLVESNYDVIAFAYDWRKDITEEAKKLDDLINKLLTKKQPIHVIAHSMGGVLFREFMILNNEWGKLNESPGFRALFLGTPLGGSYLIPETFTGRGGNINKLSQLDLKHGKQDLLEVFAACPGLYSLLPLSETPHDFGKIDVWKTMFKSSDGLGVEPSDKILEKFRAFRQRVADSVKVTDYRNIIYVAGHDDLTTATYVIENTPRGSRLVFKSTPEGDGSVTWASGIPKILKEANAVYYSKTTHGELANDKALFDAFRELLKNGHTNALPKVPPAITNRSANKLVDNPRYEIVPVTSRNLESVVLGLKPLQEEEVVIDPVSIAVSNGDLRDAKFPLIVGHFYKDGIMGAEKVLDSNFRGLLAEKHALGVYPGKIATSEVFLSFNTCPKGAIVIGLEEPDDLNGHRLELSVTQGVTKFLLALREFEQGNEEKFQKLFRNGIGISTVIVGAGYGGLSIENSIKSIILGIQKANEGIDSLHNPVLKKIGHVEFIELYEDRALQAYYTLKKLEEESQLNIILPRNRIKRLQGIRKRVPINEQQDWWQRISVSSEGKLPHNVLKFSASTSAAREEVRNLNSNSKIIQHFIDQVSKKNQWTASLAKTIFELLIPNDFKDAVRNQNNIVWKLDKFSAAYPWELLQDTATQIKPLCVTAGMVRQLATGDFRTQVQRSYKNNALIVGDPLLHDFVTQLPGAAEEAKSVAGIIKENGYAVTQKINTDFPEVIEALFQDEYKIIHLAGHGDFDPANPDTAGMIIGDNLFLTAKEIDQMSQVPEFVFVNCCHLGNVDEAAEQRSRQFYKLAANIGVQLIEMGVKAVIAAGWAVHDQAALLFAETLYNHLFSGVPFGNAVKAARAACFKDYPDTNTWGAYQCYGDQFYSLKAIATAKQRSKSYILTMEIEVDLANIVNRVESGRYDKAEILKEMKLVGEAIDRSGLRNGNITEQEGKVFDLLNEKSDAIAKFRSLRTYEEADFSVKTLERLCNISLKEIIANENATESNIHDVIKDFQLLKKIGATSERLSLLGSAYKMLFTTLYRKSAGKAEQIKALLDSAANYHEGFDVAKQNNTGILYSLCNWLQIESILILIKGTTSYNWGTRSLNGYELPEVKQAFGWMESVLNPGGTTDDDLDFWHFMDEPNVLLTKLCMDPTGKVKAKTVYESIIDAWGKGGSFNKKQSELDHLQFLLNAVSLTAKAKGKTLHSSLQSVFNQLNDFGK